MQIINQTQFQTASGMRVRRASSRLEYATAIDGLVEKLDSQRGVLLASSYEYPGRYTRWDIGFVNPPIELIARGRILEVNALNRRGMILLPEFHRILRDHPDVQSYEESARGCRAEVAQDSSEVSEEMRSRRPSIFSLLRAIVSAFRSDQDRYLGLYGALGYDLTFQFEDVERFQSREASDRDLVLYLPDQIIIADHRAEEAICQSYEFICRGENSMRYTETTGGFNRSGSVDPYVAATEVARACDHDEGEFAGRVEDALDYFRKGELFEVVPGQTFFEPCVDSPAAVFRRLQRNNPAPYGALMNLGQQEYLVAASPEMFVRVEGRQIETCPISGTIKRGTDAIGDARQIQTLLNSKKDESELSMCTDVDRNDKSRVCEAGSVKVVGRRQIEMYSRLIHTVDHVKGVLKPEFDALDGFLAHTWAVTVTGAPKLAAMQFIEQHEKSPRRWYGGAIGHIGFNGDLNTGLTLRTVRIKDGVAEIRAGATLLIDSDPQEEEAETRLKASALLDSVRGIAPKSQVASEFSPGPVGEGIRILMIDHQDSFVHNLASYFRQFGASLTTMRPEMARKWLQERDASGAANAEGIDLVVLSPGPSSPSAFAMHETLEICFQRQLTVFGVCLGMQGMVEYFGGSLEQLAYPMHGKSSRITHDGSALFSGIDSGFEVGRYHSLVAADVPPCLRVTARSEDGKVMAVEHRSLPFSALQFHPESIMSLARQNGHRLIANLLTMLNVEKKMQTQDQEQTLDEEGVLTEAG